MGSQKYRSIKLRRLRLTAQYFRDIIGGNFSMGRTVGVNKPERMNLVGGAGRKLQFNLFYTNL
jgi:hypothetical protein